MAPSFSTADIAYQNAVYRLRAACTLLERHLTPSTDEVPQPSLRPRRAPEVAECAQCAAELQELEPGSRENHVCTHRQDDDTGLQTLELKMHMLEFRLLGHQEENSLMPELLGKKSLTLMRNLTRSRQQ